MRGWICLLVSALLGCGGAREPAEDSGAALPRATRASEPPSVVLVTIDTLRREHLSCYGYFRETTPELDRVARESLVFERALATSATTFPSHLSMMTGQYMHQHGRTSNQAGALAPFTSIPGAESLAHALREAGYATAAVVSSRVLVGKTGIADGFERFRAPAKNPSRDARETTDVALQLLGSFPRERPFFLWVHYWDVHEPNEPPAEWRERFSGGPELERWLAGRGVGIQALNRRYGRAKDTWSSFFESDAPGTATLADVEDLVNRYDGDLAYLDHHLGRLVDALRASGRWEETVFVFTADHGQSLGEGGRLGHGRITNLNTFVPLVVHLPRTLHWEPGRVQRLVSLIDLAPTIVGRLPEGLLGEFPEQLAGADLLSGALPRSWALTEEARKFHGSGEAGAQKCGLLEGRWKYVVTGDGPGELYDLEAAGEGADVSADHPDVAKRLRATVQALLRGHLIRAEGPANSAEDVESMLEDLRTLGYAGDE